MAADLAEEDPRRVQARQAQAVAGPVGGLDGEAALHGEQRAQQHRHPEQAGGGLGEQGAVLVEGEAEEQQHQDGVGGDLVGGDPGPQLDPQVLARHEGGVTPHGQPRGSGAGWRRRRSHPEEPGAH